MNTGNHMCRFFRLLLSVILSVLISSYQLSRIFFVFVGDVSALLTARSSSLTLVHFPPFSRVLFCRNPCFAALYT